MTLANMLEIQGRCAQIAALVGNQDLNFLYDQGGVRITVSTGAEAKAGAAFAKAVGTYLMATRFPEPGTDPDEAKADFDKALQDYLAQVKL